MNPTIKDFKRAIQLLSDLTDLQNGCPLPTYKSEYDKTMNEIDTFLGTWKRTCSDLPPDAHSSILSHELPRNENIFVEKTKPLIKQAK